MIFDNLTFWLGAGLCVMALLQLAQWSRQSWVVSSQNKKQFELSRELLKQNIRQSVQNQKKSEELQIGKWSGYRPFRVAKLVKETAICTSVYLQPEDGKPICSFLPGQHLTFKFQIPGEAKPVIRCYSLSQGPREDFYRISVKLMRPPRNQPELPPGRASNFINNILTEGERIEVKAPAGHFHLDENSKLPVVLLAGGIGITPMASIIDYMIATGTQRPIILVYGVVNSTDHQFKDHFDKTAAEHPNFNVINCYSNPTEQDVAGRDYHVGGFASVDILKQVLKDNKCQFYMCGPPPFMDSLYNGLMEWGVPESEVFFEAFGPASIGKGKRKDTAKENLASNNASVKFAGSDVQVKWQSDCESLLELAEANNIVIDSGCRAGSCGTCATDLLQGQVTYEDPDQVECEPGKCLVCIAKPKGNIELDA